MHVAPDGTLTIYPIGVTTICRDWVPTPDEAPHEPWLRPGSALDIHPIEPPIVIPPGAPANPDLSLPPVTDPASPT
jgi:hypothetical protein